MADVSSEAIDRMLARIQDTAVRVKDGFPHWADPETGRWQTTPDGDWTGGYWVGMRWLAAAGTGD
jgi:unsaturated chondroitin disaccharide hydrolase